LSLLDLLQVVEDAEKGSGTPAFFQLLTFLRERAIHLAKSNPYVVFLAAWGAIRAMGGTVQTGYTGLFFSFGRVTRYVEPGFYFKVPFLQKVRVLPTRSRTLDVPNQKVTSGDGLVWFVDVNLVYRIVDVRKGLVEIDDLVKGMEQVLGLYVQDIVRHSGRDSMRLSGGLDQKLKAAMATSLEKWGVELESVGFTSIRPSPKTLRFTQQRHSTEERNRMLEQLEAGGMQRGHALAMLGAAPMPERRAPRSAARERLSRRKRRILHRVHLVERTAKKALSGSQLAQIRRQATQSLGL
jgi:regulator of protease activity HflC (stomatin/prohibitin superfamily)